MRGCGSLGFDVGGSVQSAALKKLTSGLSDSAVAVFDASGVGLGLRSFDGGPDDPLVDTTKLVCDAGRPAEIRPLALSNEDILRLCECDVGSTAKGGSSQWCGFEIVMETGATDRIALRPRGNRGDFTHDFLGAIWPALREDCLREVSERSAVEDDALIWMATNRIDLAIMVLNANALMLRMNVAARALIQSGAVLARSRSGLRAGDEASTRAFRDAVAACAASADPNDERTVFVQRACDGVRVPIMLSRFSVDGRPTRMVVAVLPMPPSPEKIEELARQMGLTNAEARVAKLMQLGMTNREAAAEAGLKEQTFNTYAKRVLSKLNVGCRAEMAQLLTWQAAGRFIS